MIKRFFVLSFALFLTACFGGSDLAPPPSDNRLPKGEQGGTYKIGDPYKIAGVWYYPKEDPAYSEVGIASWYGRDFHGKRTANGETYNMNALTAAHKTLPMPSFVRVTNLENGRMITLRVNDRGPFAKGRIIDVSRRAAQMLGFEKQGVTRVRVEAADERGRVKKAAQRARARERRARDEDEKAVAGRYFVQIGSYSERGNAVVQRDRVRGFGLSASILEVETDRGTFFRVRVGPYQNRTQADRTLDRLVSEGFYEARVFSDLS